MSVQASKSERYRDSEIEEAMRRLDDAVRLTQMLLVDQLSRLTLNAGKERARVADLVNAKNEPLVLIRSTVGSPQSIYHYQANPCGKAANLQSPRTLLRSEAEAVNLKFCPTCKRAYERDVRAAGTP